MLICFPSGVFCEPPEARIGSLRSHCQTFTRTFGPFAGRCGALAPALFRWQKRKTQNVINSPSYTFIGAGELKKLNWGDQHRSDTPGAYVLISPSRRPRESLLRFNVAVFRAFRLATSQNPIHGESA